MAGIGWNAKCILMLLLLVMDEIHHQRFLKKTFKQREVKS